MRQQSSGELDEMKITSESLTSQISEADTAIKEVSAALTELEERRDKVRNACLSQRERERRARQFSNNVILSTGKYITSPTPNHPLIY